MKELTWAEREVKIACENEAPDKKDGEWDYGCACYESALKAYNCLMEDGHSGFSIGMTEHILNRLIEGKPLTPIEDTEDVWNYCQDISEPNGERNVYQCKRMSSLFKDVYPDGTVEYNDVDRFVCRNVDSEIRYHSGLVDRVMDEIYPIRMPYYPDKYFLVTCEEFLTDQNNGDFDTVGILFCTDPYGRYEDIDRYFKEVEDDFVEIGKKEYMERKAMSVKLKKGDQK